MPIYCYKNKTNTISTANQSINYPVNKTTMIIFTILLFHFGMLLYLSANKILIYFKFVLHLPLWLQLMLHLLPISTNPVA